MLTGAVELRAQARIDGGQILRRGGWRRRARGEIDPRRDDRRQLFRDLGQAALVTVEVDAGHGAVESLLAGDEFVHARIEIVALQLEGIGEHIAQGFVSRRRLGRGLGQQLRGLGGRVAGPTALACEQHGRYGTGDQRELGAEHETGQFERGEVEGHAAVSPVSAARMPRPRASQTSARPNPSSALPPSNQAPKWAQEKRTGGGAVSLDTCASNRCGGGAKPSTRPGSASA